MTHGRKGQAAIEGFTTLAIIAFLFLVIIFMGVSRDADFGKKTAYMDKRDACIAVQSAVGAAIAGGSGSSAVVVISADNPIYVAGNIAEVGSSNGFSCSLPGSVAPATLSKGAIRASNSDKIITLANI